MSPFAVLNGYQKNLVNPVIGQFRKQHRLDSQGRHVSAAGLEDIVDPPGNRQRSRAVEAPHVRGEERAPSADVSSETGVWFGRNRVGFHLNVAVGDDGPAQGNPAVILNAHVNLRERAAVIDAPAAGLRHAIGADNSQTSLPCGLGGVRVQ